MRELVLPSALVLACALAGCEGSRPSSSQIRRATCGAVRVACSAAESLVCSTTGGDDGAPAP